MTRKEAIKKIKAWDFLNDDEKEVIETLIPELEESEDDIIRKELLEHCVNRRDGKQVCVDASDYRRWADWLFRQGVENIPNVKSDKEISNEIIQFLQLPHPQLVGKRHQIDWISWLEKQGEPTDNDMVEALRTEYEKGKADAFAEMQKEWSEEDENHVISLLERLEGLCRNEFERTRFAINEDQDWLKSLKDRVVPQPKQEWSKEDEDYFDAIITKLEVTQEDAALTDNQLKFLKSLKYKVFPQNTWEPSNDQMKTLELIINSHSLDAYHLGMVQHLYNGLKTLKE